MKRFGLKHYVFLLLAVCTTAFCCVAQTIAPTIFPIPIEFEVSSTDYVVLDKVTLTCTDSQAQEWAEKHLKEWYGKCRPAVEFSSGKVAVTEDEGYTLVVDESGVRISALTLQGARYALYSLRQLAIPQRGVAEVNGWIVPKTNIKDSPKMNFRGVHICWFHETEPWEVERLIRLAAYYKMNYAVIESWGTFRSDVAPWFGWQDGTMTKKEIKRLKAIADDLGITLIPQINVFGHAAQARSHAGKHATLDVDSKYQPLFEPLAGWNWCLSNPETRKLLQALIKERYEAFGHPPFFHIGCDEANKPSCPDCASQSYSKLFVEHIKAMNDTISSLGARTIMWHDMLISWEPRWNGFVTNGTKETAEGFLKLPRDIIVADWYYGGAKSEYPTIDYFKSHGFSVLASPWNTVEGIKAQCQYAHKSGIMGVLGTTWHYYYGQEMYKIYYTLSNMMWNVESQVQPNEIEMFRVQTHIRQIGWDMKLRNPRHGGLYYDEIPPEPFLNY